MKEPSIAWNPVIRALISEICLAHFECPACQPHLWFILRHRLHEYLGHLKNSKGRAIIAHPLWSSSEQQSQNSVDMFLFKPVLVHSFWGGRTIITKYHPCHGNEKKHMEKCLLVTRRCVSWEIKASYPLQDSTTWPWKCLATTNSRNSRLARFSIWTYLTTLIE